MECLVDIFDGRLCVQWCVWLTYLMAVSVQWCILLTDVTAVCILEGFQNQQSLLMADRVLRELGKAKADAAYKVGWSCHSGTVAVNFRYMLVGVFQICVWIVQQLLRYISERWSTLKIIIIKLL